MNDEHLYATFQQFIAALPHYVRESWSVERLKRQRLNATAYLPFHRSRKHHAPPYWRVSDLIAWRGRALAAMPPLDAEAFAATLRKIALKEPPMIPARKSRAGRPPHKAKAKAA